MPNINISEAINDFNRARRRASLEQIYARLTGKSTDLLSYEEVRRKVSAGQQIERGLQSVPLDSIVGSVGRYKDFTRTFLPKESISQNRWANVKAQNLGDQGLPPIELYKIGDAYFVLDGNHRVSVAREMGMNSIQAFVTEVLTKVPVTPDMKPDDLIIAEQFLHFLEKTRLDELRPEANMQVTAPGKYPLLLEHIEVHQYFMGLDFEREISWREAVTHWYDEVYLPVIGMIRERGILREFPHRTETDLYIWLAEHRAELEEELGWELSTPEAVDSLAEESTSLLTRMSDFLIEAIVGEDEEEQPLSRPLEKLARGELTDDLVLFSEILVSLGETETSWAALDQAAIIAAREGARLRGLHFTPTYEPHDHDPAVHERFDRVLAERGIIGKMADAAGDWARAISDRARWSDLIVLGLPRPANGSPAPRLPSEWRQMLHFSPRPVLAVPWQASALNKGLIAYNGSRRSREALYLGAYLAGRWGIPIVVIVVGDPAFQKQKEADAAAYLADLELQAEFVGAQGDVASNILVTLESHGCDFLIMGGISSNPLWDLFTDSTIDHVLRNAWLPVLVCQ